MSLSASPRSISPTTAPSPTAANGRRSPPSPTASAFREGGDVAGKITVEGKGVYACMVGGDDGRTLYLRTAKTTGPELAKGISTGWLEAVRAEVPHAGLP